MKNFFIFFLFIFSAFAHSQLRKVWTIQLLFFIFSLTDWVSYPSGPFEISFYFQDLQKRSANSNQKGTKEKGEKDNDEVKLNVVVDM